MALWDWEVSIRCTLTNLSRLRLMTRSRLLYSMEALSDTAKVSMILSNTISHYLSLFYEIANRDKFAWSNSHILGCFSIVLRMVTFSGDVRASVLHFSNTNTLFIRIHTGWRPHKIVMNCCEIRLNIVFLDKQTCIKMYPQTWKRWLL